MTDRPILMSAPMVRAMLDGRKTQTRRLAWRTFSVPAPSAKAMPKGVVALPDGSMVRPTTWQKVKPGDRLWVRETWNADWCDHTIYRADGGSAKDAGYRQEPRWRPSIYMPRWASRFTLVVDWVRIERVQEIDRAGAIAEGCSMPTQRGGMHPWPEDQYRRLWDALHGREAWEANPYVVVIGFTPHHRNIDQMEAAA